MGSKEIGEFLTHLAVDRGVVASTQNQASNALVYLFREVLRKDPGEFSAPRAKQSRHLPVVLTAEEIKRLLSALDGEEALQARLLYGCGLRIMELLRLRVKDVDIEGTKLFPRPYKLIPHYKLTFNMSKKCWISMARCWIFSLPAPASNIPRIPRRNPPAGRQSKRQAHPDASRAPLPLPSRGNAASHPIG